MDDLRFTRQKILQIKREISRVRTSDFHHPAVKRMLFAIDEKFDLLSEDIDENEDASLDIKQGLCLRANLHIAHFHAAIGFILRSTNARNPFEIYDPLLRLSRGFLGPNATLILSSEWEFVPFSTPSVFAGLPECTLIGLPVVESTNALIVPLAGHELGHAVYQARAIYDDLNMVQSLSSVFDENWAEFEEHLEHFKGISDRDSIVNQIEIQEWGQSPLEWMSKICEEIFCDMFGVRLFGMGYLYAFEYLCAPGIGKTDLQEYSPLDQRACYLVDAIRHFAKEAECEQDVDTTKEAGSDSGELECWSGLAGFTDRFGKEPEPGLDPVDKFLLDSAHKACNQLITNLRGKAGAICDGWRNESLTGVAFPTLSSAKKVANKFSIGLPTMATLPDAVNGGWLDYLKGSNDFEFVNELVFKSLDVAEFEERIERECH